MSAGKTVVVTGASRGFGRAIAASFATDGYDVIGIGRSADALDEVRTELGTAFTPVVGDVSQEGLAADVLAAYRPDVVVLNAGTSMSLRPFTEQTWAEFRQPWDVDVFQSFEWLTAVLATPLAPGSSVVTLSSGAALRGSPLSGGYAGAKAMVRFLTTYAADESRQRNLGLRFTSLLPGLTPATEFGARGAAAYAAYEGITLEQFEDRMAPVLEPHQVADAVRQLVAEPEPGLAYLVTAAGTTNLDAE